MKRSDFNPSLLTCTAEGDQQIAQQGICKILMDKVEEESLDMIALLANEWLDLRTSMTRNDNRRITISEVCASFLRQAVVNSACQILPIKLKQLSAETDEYHMKLAGAVDKKAFALGWTTIKIEIREELQGNPQQAFNVATLRYDFNLSQNTNRVTNSNSDRKAHIGPRNGLFDPEFKLTAPALDIRTDTSSVSGLCTTSQRDFVETIYGDTLLRYPTSNTKQTFDNNSLLHPMDWLSTASSMPLPQSRPASAQNHYSEGFGYGVGSVLRGGHSRTSSFGSQASSQGGQSPSGLSDGVREFSFNNYNPAA